MTRQTLLVVSILLIGCSQSGDPKPDANGVVGVPDELSCPNCTITSRVVTTLEVPADTTDGQPVHVESDAQGRIWILRQGDLPVIFDSTGKFLRVLGRTGQGPGEYYNPWSLLVVGRDSILLMDRNRRGTWLDSALTPRSYQTLPMLLRHPTVVKWPNVVVGSGNLPYHESRGPLYHWTFENGAPSIVRQFSAVDMGNNPEMMLYTNHEFSTPRDGRFWAMWGRKYSLREFGDDLSQRRLLERRPAWFLETSPVNYNWKSEPPPPHVAGVEQDDEGLIWAFIHVAAPTWKEAWPTVPDRVREVPSKTIQHELLYAVRLEIIDPRRARVVARSDIPRYLINAMPDRRAAFYDVNDQGSVIQILEFDLKRK